MCQNHAVCILTKLTGCGRFADGSAKEKEKEQVSSRCKQ